MLPTAVTQALVVCPPKMSGSSAGTMHERGELPDSDRAWTREERPLTHPIDDADREDQDREAAGDRGEVGDQRPLELHGPEQLGEKDEREQRHSAVEDVGRRLEVLVEERQAGVVEALAVVGDIVLGTC